MPTQRFAAASLQHELNSSWSKTTGTSYIHQSGLATNELYLHTPVPPDMRTLSQVRVRVTPVAHAVLPASLPRVTVFGVTASGSSNQLGQGDDVGLTAGQYEIGHNVGNLACNFWNTGTLTHEHGGRGVNVGASMALYVGLRLEIRGESGANSATGLKVESVELDYY